MLEQQLTRNVFGPYWNGRENVYADPLAVHRELIVQTKGDPNSVFDRMDEAKNPDPLSRAQATALLLTSSRVALAMIPFDPKTGNGATDEWVMRAIRDFTAWMSKKKATPRPSPTSSGPTAQ